MLSDQEKMEMLHDAGSSARKAAFRQTRVKTPRPSYDAYLRFLAGLQDLFRRTETHFENRSNNTFKL